MKKIPPLLIYLMFTFMSCDVYTQETYPTLSGTYEISVIRAKYVTPFNTKIDTVLMSGTFFTNRAKPPLDNITQGEWWSFDYSTLYLGHYMNGYGGEDWRYNFSYSTPKNYVGGGDYNQIRISFFDEIRTFEIIEDGLQTLIIKSKETWYNTTDNKRYEEFTFVMNKIGA